MYKSPIEIYASQMSVEYENGVLQYVQKYFPYVDKDELYKALQYDRNQYDEGFVDGATELANRLKEWFVENSNYWFSHSVNMDIDEVLNNMISK